MTILAFDLLWRDRGASKGMQDLGRHTDRAARSFHALKVGAGIALVAAAGAAVKFGASSVRAYVDAQTQQVKLQDAFRKFPKLADTNQAALQRLNTELQKKTKFDDDATASGQAVLAQFKLTGRQITELTPLMQDYAAKTGKSLPAAATVLGRALMGNARALKAVGINIPPVADATKVLAAAQKSVTTTSDNLHKAQQRLADLQAIQASKTKLTVSDQIALRRAQDAVREATTRHEGALHNLSVAQDGAKKGGSAYADVVKGLRKQVGGFAENEGKSAAGQAAILKNQFGDLQEEAGKFLLPALNKVVGGLIRFVGFIQDNSAVFGTFGKTVRIVFGSITKAIFGSTDVFKTFSDFVATHQADIIAGIIAGGKAALRFAGDLGTLAAVGLRSFAFLMDGQARVVALGVAGYGNLLDAATLAFGWLPDLGPKLIIASARFKAFGAGAVASMHGAAAGARTAADGIDTKLRPALNKAGQSLDALGKKEIASAHNRDIMARAEIRHRDAVNAASAAAKTNGRTLDSNTISGRANRVALNGLVSSSQNYIAKLAATNAGSRKVTDATRTARAEFIRVAQSMGVSSTRAKDLADKYFHIPKKAETKVTQPGMSKARNDTKDLDNRINGLNNKKVTITYASNAAKFAQAFKLGLSLNSGERGSSQPGGARGGILPGFTPLSRGDDVAFPMANGGIQPLRGGEGIAVSEVMRDPHERALLLAKNKAALRGESMAQFREGLASGGVLSRLISTPSAGRIAMPDFNTLGNRLAKGAAAELGREIGAKLDKAAKAAAAAGGGGPIGKGGYASALSYARAHRGHPYIFGSLWDCSGFMSALHSIILGQRPHRRYTTTAFHGAHAAGFTRGKSSPFMVGVRPLAGKFGHMAGTLNGVNVESAGGVGVRVGGSARGAHSGMFSWRGGLAGGGVIRVGRNGVAGDLPFDLLDPQGQRYNPELADLLHKAGYHRGGSVGERGPERILSPAQNRNFENLVRAMDRRGGATVVHNHYTVNAPHYVGNHQDLVNALVQADRRGQLAVIKRSN